MAQGGAGELAGRLQVLLRQLRQQPLRQIRVEAAGAAEGRAADAVHASWPKSPAFKPANIGISPKLGISKDNLGAQAGLPTPSKIVTLPAKGTDVDQPGQRQQQQRHDRQGHDPARQDRDQSAPPAPATTAPPERSPPCPARSTPFLLQQNNGNARQVTTLPGRINGNPIRVQTQADGQARPARNSDGSFGGGNSSAALGDDSARMRSARFGGGGFRR